MEWQARHLLNEALPAAASCANAAADDATTNSALNTIFFMVCSSPWVALQCLVARGVYAGQVSKRLPGSTISPAWPGWLTFATAAGPGELPKAVQTCLISHDKSAS